MVIEIHFKTDNNQREIPEEDAVFRDVEKIVGRWIHGEIFLQKRVFPQIAVDVSHVRRFFGFADGVEKRRRGGFQERG